MIAGTQPQAPGVIVSEDHRSHVPMALLNLKGGAMLAPGRYDFDRLERVAAQLSTPPSYFGLCLTDLAAWFWPVTRDFTKITCSRRRRIAGRARVARVRDRGRYAGRRGVVPA